MTTGKLYRFPVEDLHRHMQRHFGVTMAAEAYRNKEDTQCSCGHKTDRLFVLAETRLEALQHIHDGTSGFSADCMANQLAEDGNPINWGR